MREYYRTLETFKQAAESDPTVNTVSADLETEIDVNKKDIFPYVQIGVTGGGRPRRSTLEFTVEVIALDIRDEAKTDEPTDKFWGKDNMHDNLNLTHAILARMCDLLEDYLVSDNAVISELSAFEPIVYDYSDLLDGWRMTVTVQVPRDDNGIC